MGLVFFFFSGTFITEWTDGAAVCETFLSSEESYRAVADKLVQISHYYGFEGWLVNIENPLSVSYMLSICHHYATLINARCPR